ncbi:MAG: trigger factor [Proteobacteria bacterium]|nr:trigger factor [Pseudomonadota bacterium]MBU1648869.1 trigger factor [Pseudomonadota bacterium]
MDVVVEKLTDLTRKITITLPENDVQKELKDAYDKVQRDVKLKGFRRGKVPRSVILKNFQQKVEAEVAEKLVQDTYFAAIEQEKIDPVVHPEISEPRFKDDGTFSYVAMIDIKPDFELQGYKGLEVEKPVVEVSEEEIAAELESLRVEMAPLRSVDDRSVVKGDVAVVDFQGFYNDKPMKEVKNENFSVDVGSGRISPEFEEKLVGMKKGEEANHEVEFPAKYPNPVLAGKKVTFKVKVKDVKERLLPELDDEFAKDVGSEYASLAELKTAIRDRIAKEKEEKADGDLTDRIMHKLLENHTFPVPVRLVRYEVEEMIKSTEKSLEQNGLDLESAGINRAELAERNRATAEKRVRGDFILKKIADVEAIKVNDEDMDRGFKRIGDQYNMPVAQVKEYFGGSRDDILPFVNELLNEKILAFLRAEAKLVDAADVVTVSSENEEA